MKRLQTSAMLALTGILLASCGDSSGGGTSTYDLTVNLEGLTSAPVKVTNTATGAVIFNDTVTTSKTISSIVSGTNVKVEGLPVNNYTAPDAQTVTLDSSKTVTLKYTASLPGSPLNNAAISGVIQGNTLKLGTVYLPTYSNQRFLSSPVDANNAIHIPLTATPASTDLYQLFKVGPNTSCQGTNSNPNAKGFASVTLPAYSPDGDLLGEVGEIAVAGTDVSSAGNTLVARVYADQPFSVVATCTGASGTDDINVTFQQGWNAILLTSNGGNLTFRNAPTDVRTILKFIAEDARVSVSLNPSELNFTTDTNQTISVAARFAQVGGYSGQVTLSTDIDGLTVEPGTITLNALQSLSLKPQLLATNLTFKYTGTQPLSKQPFNLIIKDAAGQQVGGGTGTISAQRPGFIINNYYGDLRLPVGSTVQREFSLSSQQNFQGTVTVTAEGLPAGVTVTPAVVNLGSSYYASGTLSLTASTAATPGTYPITLVGTSGSTVSRQTVNLIIPQPTVSLNIANSYSGLEALQGSTAYLETTVSSVDGFNGSTTLTVTGLPAGITAQPVTVQVSSGTSTTVKIPLVVGTDAPLGSVKVSVTSPDLASNYGAMNSITLNVMPPHYLVGQTGYGMTRTSTGVWIVTGDTYNSTTSQYELTVKHFVNGQVVATATLPHLFSGRLISMNSGDVLAFSGSGSAKTAYLVKPDGTMNSVQSPFTYADTVADTADSQNRIWFIQRTNLPTGGTSAVLANWNVSTGAVSIVDSTTAYETSMSAGRFTVSNDGTKVLFENSYSSQGIKIDVANTAITPVNFVNSSSSSSAIANDWTVWKVSFGRLQRTNADGSATTFNNVMADRVIGFDMTDPSVLWLSTYSDLIKYNISTGTSATFAAGGSQPGAVTINEGGVALLTQVYSSTSYGYNYYLSYYK